MPFEGELVFKTDWINMVSVYSMWLLHTGGGPYEVMLMLFYVFWGDMSCLVLPAVPNMPVNFTCHQHHYWNL